VIFLDLNMPGTDGYGFLASFAGGALPTVIVVSADVQPLAQARALAMGAKAFVGKPVTRANVEAALRACGALDTATFRDVG
jgi:CheY-like chemotaxis protein